MIRGQSELMMLISSTDAGDADALAPALLLIVKPATNDAARLQAKCT